MPQQEKIQKVEELKHRIEGSAALFLADFRGLTVGDVMELRRTLGASGTKFSVVKNTLMKRAADDAGVEDLDRLLEGPTAVAFVDGDAVAAAKGLVDALRRFRTMTIKGGYMEGRVLSAEQAQAIATIEPREVLLARIAGGAKASMSRAAYMFQALQSRFLALLEAFREKVPSGGDAEVPAAEEAPGAEAAVTTAASEEAPGAGPEEVVTEDPTAAGEGPQEEVPEGGPEPTTAGGEPATEVEETAPEADVPAEATEEETPTTPGDDQSVTEAQTSPDGEEGKE